MSVRLNPLDLVICIAFIYLYGYPCGSICPSGWLFNGTSCYLLVQTGMSWNLARNHCISLNAYLAEVTTYSEHEFLTDICEEDGAWSYYIGGTDADEEGTWLWTGSGSAVTNFSWGPLEPNGGPSQNCIQLLSIFQYMFDDVSCTLHSFRFFCELDLAADVSTTLTATTPTPNNVISTTEMIVTTSLAEQTTPVPQNADHSSSALHTTPDQETSTAIDSTTSLEMTSLNMGGSCVDKRIFYSPCCCSRNETQEEIEQLILEFRRYLTISKTDTSKHKRALISVPDHRPSAAAVGYCGVIVLVSVLLIVISFDILTLIQRCCRSNR